MPNDTEPLNFAKKIVVGRGAYKGKDESMVVAIDVGTTFSGVSFARLIPNEVPKIESVMRFPGHVQGSGDHKIPSVMYYDKRGQMVAAGAETQMESIIEQAEDNEWKKVEHFKLHLKPSSMAIDTHGLRLGTLPDSKDETEVFSDFLGYMLKCAVEYINESYPGHKPPIWEKVKGHAQFVITHPNGWEGAQQQLMRRAAVMAGMIPDTIDGHGRLTCTTEGEASLHGCLSSRPGHSNLQEGDAFIIADAGGGTLDINTYEVVSASPLRIQEMVQPDCRFAGSLFVNMRARKWFEEKLSGTGYADPTILDDITSRAFEQTKRLFFDQTQPSWVKIGGLKENDSAHGIKSGKVKMPGSVLKELFEFSVQQCIEAVRQQKKASKREEIDVWLVGGFAASPWLFSQLKQSLAADKINVFRPDTNASKVVADGAISYYLDHWVDTRVARFATGVCFEEPYDSTKLDHTDDPEKKRLVHKGISGVEYIGPKFECFVSRGTKVSETMTVTNSYYDEFASPSQAQLVVNVYVYRGDIIPAPVWKYKDEAKFDKLCTVQADLSKLCTRRGSSLDADGEYWRVSYQVEFRFGLAEYEARLKWKDDGETKYSTASIIYDQ